MCFLIFIYDWYNIRSIEPQVKLSGLIYFSSMVDERQDGFINSLAFAKSGRFFVVGVGQVSPICFLSVIMCRNLIFVALQPVSVCMIKFVSNACDAHVLMFELDISFFVALVSGTSTW